MTDEPQLVTHEDRPHVMREGSVGTCHFCGCIVRFETRFHRGRRRVVILCKRKRLNVGSKRWKWALHKCPVARQRERQRRAGYASEIRE